MGSFISRTPLLGLAQRVLDAAMQPEIIDNDKHFAATSRRGFLQQTILGGSALALGPWLSRFGQRGAADTPTVAIIGAGMAGISAAWYLKNAGINATIYEASGRVGGRINSANGLMGEGLITELGAEFVDTTHTDLHTIIKHYGLELLDTITPEESALETTYYFMNRRYSFSELVAEMRPYAKQMRRDVRSLPKNISYLTPEASALDKLSLSAYLDTLGMSGVPRQLLELANVSEYGANADDQTCLNMLAFLSVKRNGKFAMMSDSDERYKVKGGNVQMCERMAASLGDQIKFNCPLSAVSRRGDGGFSLVFDERSGIKEQRPDFVIMAIPFTILRRLDLKKANLPAWKTDIINELGYGRNAKFFFGFKERFWRAAGQSGFSASNTGLISTWDNTQCQPGKQGSLTVFTGGKYSDEVLHSVMHEGPAPTLAKIAKLFPGAEAQYNDITSKFFWPDFAYSKASYSSYKPGQWTTFGGREQEPIDQKMFFAGEHCSLEHQGFMNGAAQTGRQAAEGILALVGK